MRNAKTLLAVISTIALFAAFSTETLAATKAQSRRNIKTQYYYKKGTPIAYNVKFKVACAYTDGSGDYDHNKIKYTYYGVQPGGSISVRCTGQYSSKRFVIFNNIVIPNSFTNGTVFSDGVSLDYCKKSDINVKVNVDKNNVLTLVPSCK